MVAVAARIKPQRDRLARRRAVAVDDHAAAFRVARDVVEEDRRRTVGCVEQRGDFTDVRFPAGARDVTQLARGTNTIDPLARVAPGFTLMVWHGGSRRLG